MVMTSDNMLNEESMILTGLKVKLTEYIQKELSEIFKEKQEELVKEFLEEFQATASTQVSPIFGREIQVCVKILFNGEFIDDR